MCLARTVSVTGARLARVVLTLVVALLIQLDSAASDIVMISKSDLVREFLLQTSYQQAGSREDFNTSRSRIVIFERGGETLRMIETHRGMGLPDRVLAYVPIRGETDRALAVDFNAGFDRVFTQEDRTGEDYNGRSETED